MNNIMSVMFCKVIILNDMSSTLQHLYCVCIFLYGYNQKALPYSRVDMACYCQKNGNKLPNFFSGLNVWYYHACYIDGIIFVRSIYLPH